MCSDRVFVLGLDGLPWNLIEGWAEEGKLENFGRLFEEGAAGPLESTTPPTTSLAWPSISTGVHPDQHGIYHFQNLDGAYTHRMHTSGDRKSTPLWEILSPAVVGNVPMTYPASEIDGKMVTGMMTPELNDRFAHPPELKADVERAIPDYEIGLKWSEYADRRDEFVDEIRTLTENRRKLMRLLMDTDDWRLFFFVYTAPDRLQHLCWEESVLLDHYRHLDEIVGETMAYAEEYGANLFVVSDHGFGPITSFAHPNRVLEQEGFLSRRSGDGKRGLLEEVGVTKDAIRYSLDRLGIDESTLVKYLPQTVTDAVAEQVPGDHALYDVDFGETTAFFHGVGNVYVNDTERFDDGIVPPEDVDRVKLEVIEAFERVTDPETGQPVFYVADGDELFPRDDGSPDVIVKGQDDYEVQPALTDDVFTEPAMEASHRHEGLFFAWGPSVAAGARPVDATVYDVAPTALHSIGESIPEHMDGQVLETVLSTDTAPDRRQVADDRADAAADSDEDFGDVEDRLRGLGYIE